MPRAIDAALGKAGATRLTEFASGDADSTLEESFEEWKFALWEGLSAHLGICELFWLVSTQRVLMMPRLTRPCACM